MSRRRAAPAPRPAPAAPVVPEPGPTRPRAFAERAAPFAPLGDTGLVRWGGIVLDDPVQKLRGGRWYAVVREMASGSPVVKGMLFAIEMLIRRAEWYLDPADSGAEAKEVADFVDSCRVDMASPWEDTLASVVGFLAYGFSLHEVIYKRRLGPSDDPSERSAHADGLIGWRRWSPRAQETVVRWVFDDAGVPIAFVQRAPIQTGEVLIPLSRCLHFKAGGYRGNPEGESILRAAYDSWEKIRVIQHLESVGIERDLAGLPVIYAPSRILRPDASAAEKRTREALEAIASGIRQNDQAGVVMPMEYEEGKELYKLQLLSSGGQRQFDTDKVIRRHAWFMTLAILADFLTLGHESVGTYSAAVGKQQMFALAVQAWLDAIANVINDQAIRPLLAINGIDAALTPVLRPGVPDAPDLAGIGDYFVKLAKLVDKLDPADLDTLATYLFDVADWPAPTKPLKRPEPVPEEPRPGGAGDAAREGELDGEPADAAIGDAEGAR